MSISREWFKRPFYYFDLSYNFTPLIGEKETSEDCEDFPENIEEYIWGEEGENDNADWNLLAKLTNGKFILFTAWCDYTGFDCQSGIKLYVASNIEILFNKAMTTGQRNSYTEYIKKE